MSGQTHVVHLRAPALHQAERVNGTPSRSRGMALETRPLLVGAHDSPAERDADRAADEARRGALLTPVRSGFGEESVTPAPAAVNLLGRPGRMLDQELRRDVELRFRRSFGHVRLHDDATASTAAASIGASGFTYQDHVVLDRRHASAGQAHQLILHELAHVAQGAGIIRRSTPIHPGSPHPPPPTVARDREIVAGPDDIQQGGWNDCFLMAALLALTSSSEGRRILEAGIRRLGPGRWSVRLFHDPHGTGTAQEQWYSVSPLEGGATESALWARLYEAAFAARYDNVAPNTTMATGAAEVAGGAARALFHLTGRAGHQLMPRAAGPSWADQIWDRLVTADASGEVALLCTVRDSEFRAVHEEIKAVPGGDQLVGHHAFVVLRRDGAGAARTLTLRNPWGCGVTWEQPVRPDDLGDRGDPRRSPEFTVSLAAAARAASWISTGSVPGRARVPAGSGPR